MPDVKIKGYSGAELEFQNVPKVWLAAPESTAEEPVLVPFTYGEAVEGVEITLDFSEGDMTVTMEEGLLAKSTVIKKPESLVPGNIKKDTSVAGIVGEYEDVVETEKVTVAADFSAGDMVVEPSDGKLLERATVTKPETLIPENIAEGVDIAGIIGTLTGGGGSLKVATGTIATTSTSAITISHGLGVSPDIIVYYSYWLSSAPYIEYFCGYSSKFKEKVQGLSGMTFSGMQSNKTRTFSSYSGNITTSVTNMGLIHSANEDTFTINAGTTYPAAAQSTWIAIGGLT